MTTHLLNTYFKPFYPKSFSSMPYLYGVGSSIQVPSFQGGVATEAKRWHTPPFFFCPVHHPQAPSRPAHLCHSAYPHASGTSRCTASGGLPKSYLGRGSPPLPSASLILLTRLLLFVETKSSHPLRDRFKGIFGREWECASTPSTGASGGIAFMWRPPFCRSSATTVPWDCNLPLYLPLSVSRGVK